MNTAAKLLGSKEDDIRRATVRFIGDTITKCGSQDNVANAESFSTADGLPLIVKLLTDKEQHIQSMCAGVIRVLSGYEGRTQSGLSFQDDFRKAGAVAPLVTLLQSEQPDMIRQAAGAIRGLAEGNKANRDAFVDADCIAILLKHLEAQTDPKVQAHVLSTIYTLTIANSKAAEQLQKGEGMKLLKKEFSTDFPEKHELILGIWKNMALDNTAVQNYLREQGILDVVIETINKNTPEKVESKTSSPGQSLSPKEKVQKSSCSALAALTSGNSESISVAMKANMLEKLTKLLDLECDPIVSRSLSAIRSLITKSKANQNKLLEMRPITRTLDLCLAKSTEVRDQAVAVLAQCLGNEKVKKELFSKALPIMIQLIDPVPVPDALAVIQVLLEDESQRAIVTKDKRAISLFVSFLEEKNEKVIINDCAVISALSLGNKSGQNAIIKADAAFKLVKLLGTSSVPVIQHHAAYSIWAVSKNNSKAQNAFGKANAVNALVSILKDEKSSDVLKEYSIGALYALVTDNSTNKKSTVSCNGIEAILPLLNAGPQKIRVNAAKALWAMCESHSFFKAPSTSEAILKNQERAAAGIPALVKLLKADKFNSQAAAASALYSLAHRNTKNQNTLREAGALPVLVSVVKNNYKEFSSGQKNASQGEAVKWSVITIGALAWKNPANQNALIKEGAVTILEPLRDSNIEWLQREGVIALDHLGAKKAKAPAAEKPKKEEKKTDSKKEETPKPSPAPVKKAEENNNTKKAESSSEEDDSDDSEEESSDEAPKKPDTAKIDPKIPDTPKVEQKQPETPKVEPKAAPAPAPKKEESSSEEDSDESESDEEPPKKEEPKKQETPKVEKKEEPKSSPAPAKKEESSSEEDSDESESDSE